MISERENFYRMVNKQELEFVPSMLNLIQLVISSTGIDRGEDAGSGPGVDGFGVRWGGVPAVPDPEEYAPKAEAFLQMIQQFIPTDVYIMSVLNID